MRGTKVSRVRLRISPFKGVDASTAASLLAPNFSPNTYNFTFSGGALRAKIGIDKAELGLLTDKKFRHYLPALPENEKIENLHFYRKYNFTESKRDDKIVVRTNTGSYYVAPCWSTGTFDKIDGIAVTGDDCSVNYRFNGKDVLIVAGKGGGLYIYDGESISYAQNAPSITSMCVHYERIYATVAGESNSLWFSDDFDPSNWNTSLEEGGFINFDDDGGRVIKAVSFLDHVYVFRDYGIVRLTAYGSQENYSVSKIYASASRIIADTIALCGDRIVFLTDEGLFSFNGYTLTHIASKIENLFYGDRTEARGAYVKGHYYLACRLRADEKEILSETDHGSTNNCVVRINLKTGDTDILRGADVKGLVSVECLHISEMLVFFRGEHSHDIGMMSESGKLFSTLLPKHWESAQTDLGRADKTKTVRTVNVSTSTDLNFTVTLDGKSKTYFVKGGTEPKKIVVNKKGKTVGFAVDTDKKDPLVSAITVEADLA